MTLNLEACVNHPNICHHHDVMEFVKIN